MDKKTKGGVNKSAGRCKSEGISEIIAPRLKLSRPIRWYGGTIKSVSDHIEHLLTELGRLGWKVDDIERHYRPPNTETVLSD